jgi:hypothetical protein
MTNEQLALLIRSWHQRLAHELESLEDALQSVLGLERRGAVVHKADIGWNGSFCLDPDHGDPVDSALVCLASSDFSASWTRP